MSAPTAPMIAPSNHAEPVASNIDSTTEPSTNVDSANSDNANNDSANVDQDIEMKIDEPAQVSSPLSSQSSQVTNSIKEAAAADDSEAETDIASTNNTPVKNRTRPGFQYSLDSNDTVSKRPSEIGLLTQAAALARKRKAEGEAATDIRRSRSRTPIPETASNNATKKARLSPDLATIRSSGAKSSDLPTERATRAGTPSDRSTSNLLAQARPHLAESSRAKTEPRMRSHSPANARSSHRRSSSFHTAAAAAAAASADRERRARNRQSLESVSNENTPIPGRARHLESTPAYSPMARRDKDSTGRTQLAQACDKGHVEKVKELLADATKEYINEPDNAGTSPVQMAALKGHVDIVKLLIDAGAKIDGANQYGDTPLIDAVENSHVDVVNLLLKHGVDPWRANNRGDRPADLVNDDDEEDNIRQLLKDACETWNAQNQGSVQNIPRPQVPKTRDLLYVAPNSKNLRDFAENGDTEGVKYMYKCTVVPNNDCLVAAARGGHVDTVLEMLEYAKSWALPYDPDPELVDGETAMLAAIERGNTGVIRKLLEWDKQGLDARRLIKGKTYFDTLESMSMKPPGWEEGYSLLKAAYEDEERSSIRGSPGPDPPRRRKLMTGKQRNEEAASKAAEDGHPSDASPTKQSIKSETENDENSKQTEVSSALEAHQRELAKVKEQLREKIRVQEERKAKETAKTNLEIQAKAETKAQEEAKQRVVEEKEARAAAAAAKQAKAREAALKIQAEAKAARQAREAEAAVKLGKGVRSPRVNPKSPEKDVAKVERLRLEEEEKAKAERIEPEAEVEAQRKKAEEEVQRKETEAQEVTRRHEEEIKADTRRKEEAAEAAKEEARQKQEEARRQETARIEEEIARRRAAEKEAQEQAERERKEKEAQAAAEALQKQKAEVARLKALEESRLKAEAESRLKAEEEARLRAIEERKTYLSRLPRALSKALQLEHFIQPEHVVRPNGPEYDLDYLNSLESHWQPIPLFRQSEIAMKGNDFYTLGFIASTYLRHNRLDDVRNELHWSTIPCTRAQRKLLWDRAGISHFLVRDHDWALAPAEARKDCGIDVEVDMLGVAQIDWAELYDDGKKKWLDMDDEQCLWVRWDDLLSAAREKEWLRGVEIRTSAWDCLGENVGNGVNGTAGRKV